MRKPLISKGDKYGRLTAVEFVKKDKNYQLWLFVCDCGNKKVLRISSVKNGNTESCGCINREMISKRNYKHGMAKTITYISWYSMKTRCLNKNRKYYYRYGGRGITICPEWLNSFTNFLADMGERPKGKTLDRKDNNGNYCKSNCRWATAKQQRLNQ